MPSNRREEAIALVRDRLFEAERGLLTLTGTGGGGKTRLALEVAREVLDSGEFPDNAGQIATFNQIRQAFTSGQVVSAWTEDKVDKISAASVSATGHSGGEDVAEGLVGQHAYSVVACDPPNGALPPNAQCWITVRNPWGHYGRQFDPLIDPVPSVKPTATSRIELSDFTTRFKRIVNAPGP